MARARFLLSPKWLLSHLLVIGLAVLMISLGFWQLRRLDERRERNDLIRSRAEQPAVPIDELLAPGDRQSEVDAVRLRHVTATGTYDDEATVVVRNRSQGGVAGAWLLTPLTLDDGGDGDSRGAGDPARVGVIRGFVGFGPDGDPYDATPPEGTVTVQGVVVAPEGLDGTAPRDVEPVVAARDTMPALVLASRSEPPEPASVEGGASGDQAVLVPVSRPDIGEGPHLSYAVQWFLFSAIGVVGYPLVLRRVVRNRGKELDDAADLDRELEELLRQGG